MRVALLTLGLGLAALACNSGPKPDPSAQPAARASQASTPAPSNVPEGTLRLGAAIEASAPQVALSDVAKQPQSYTGKTFATTGTVTAVCQHMGCWMEIKDDASSAHIKMAGHAFFVPKTASGHKARVLARLESAQNESTCEGEGHDKGDKKGCRAEAESQLGRPLAKLELVAEGVELL
jgi:hypothetical protein